MGSICEIAVRVVNLQAAIRTREIVEPSLIRDKVLEIESDLRRLKASAPGAWRYTANTTLGMRFRECPGGIMHVYPSLWVAEAWNGWRAVRVLAHQILRRNEWRGGNLPFDDSYSESASIIQETSIDMCASVSTLLNTPSEPPGSSGISKLTAVFTRKPITY